jgi:hypothetical protein
MNIRGVRGNGIPECQFESLRPVLLFAPNFSAAILKRFDKVVPLRSRDQHRARKQAGLHCAARTNAGRVMIGAVWDTPRTFGSVSGARRRPDQAHPLRRPY